MGECQLYGEHMSVAPWIICILVQWIKHQNHCNIAEHCRHIILHSVFIWCNAFITFVKCQVLARYITQTTPPPTTHEFLTKDKLQWQKKYLDIAKETDRYNDRFTNHKSFSDEGNTLKQEIIWFCIDKSTFYFSYCNL